MMIWLFFSVLLDFVACFEAARRALLLADAAALLLGAIAESC